MASAIIAQNVLMAITVTVNKYASSNVQSVHKTKKKEKKKPPSSINGQEHLIAFPRRALLFSTASLLAPSSPSQATPDSQTELLNKYLKKTEENKAKNDKERMDSYYKRNYKDYFDFVEGGLKGKEELTEAEKGIVEWLKKNK